MSSFVIKVSTDVMIQQAETIKSGVDEIRNRFRSVTTQVRGSRNFWQGDASDLHMERFEVVKEQMEELVGILRGYPDELLRMANLYDESERRATEDASSLPMDVFV